MCYHWQIIGYLSSSGLRNKCWTRSEIEIFVAKKVCEKLLTFKLISKSDNANAYRYSVNELIMSHESPKKVSYRLAISVNFTTFILRIYYEFENSSDYNALEWLHLLIVFFMYLLHFQFWSRCKSKSTFLSYQAKFHLLLLFGGDRNRSEKYWSEQYFSLIESTFLSFHQT